MSLFPSLLPYGWKNSPLPVGATPARVIRHDGARLTVITPDGQRTLANSPQLEPQPTVGDWLAIDRDDRIIEVLERHSLLRRRAADDSGAQALAANVDLVLITCGIDRPIKPGRIHRSIAQARDAGAEPLIVLTKATLEAARVDARALERQHSGLEVFVTSALEGVGIDELGARLAGLTAVLLGESGAGKSTLANALLGADRAATGDVRDGDAKGRHTTTSRQLYLLPGGGVNIDTPGIRSVGLFADAAAIDASVSEIQDFALGCRFHDCGHGSEPGCAVREAIESGELDAERFETWLHLQKEVANAALRADPRAWHQYARQYGRTAKEGKARKRR